MEAIRRVESEGQAQPMSVQLPYTSLLALSVRSIWVQDDSGGPPGSGHETIAASHRQLERMDCWRSTAPRSSARSK